MNSICRFKGRNIKQPSDQLINALVPKRTLINLVLTSNENNVKKLISTKNKSKTLKNILSEQQQRFLVTSLSVNAKSKNGTFLNISLNNKINLNYLGNFQFLKCNFCLLFVEFCFFIELIAVFF